MVAIEGRTSSHGVGGRNESEILEGLAKRGRPLVDMNTDTGIWDLCNKCIGSSAFLQLVRKDDPRELGRDDRGPQDNEARFLRDVSGDGRAESPEDG